nr:hypothetical protein [Sphingomonas sp. Y57]
MAAASIIALYLRISTDPQISFTRLASHGLLALALTATFYFLALAASIEFALVHEPEEERRRAKVGNERLKLFANLLNSAAVAVLVSVVLIPFLKDGARPDWATIGLGILSASGIHFIAHCSLSFLRSEG